MHMLDLPTASPGYFTKLRILSARGWLKLNGPILEGNICRFFMLGHALAASGHKKWHLGFGFEDSSSIEYFALRIVGMHRCICSSTGN